MTSNSAFSKDSFLDNELTMTLDQNDYLMPLCYDTVNEGIPYVDHSTEKLNSMSFKDKLDVLSSGFGQTTTYSEPVYNDESNSSSYYGLVPNLPMDSFSHSYSLSNDAPIRLSSPINLNLSSSLPNPTIEQFQPKKALNSCDTLNNTFSPSSSNGGYESTSPPTAFKTHSDMLNAFSFSTRALSTSPVPSAEAIVSKRKSPSRSNVPSTGIKRPLNSFMLYRRDKQSSIPTNNHQSISRIIGEMWKRETIEEKERYAEMALRERERHAKEYPDYKFLPRKKKDKNLNGKSPRRRKTYDPALEQDESKILRMMLSQISHRKSQSDVEKIKIDQNNYNWLLEDNGDISLKKTFFDNNVQSNYIPNIADNLQLMPNVYEYANQNTAPPVFPVEDSVDNTSVYDSLNTCPSTFDNFNDYNIRTLMNTCGTSYVNESLLGNIFNKGCSKSPQNIPIYSTAKNVDSTEKSETQTVPLLSTFDSTVLQDDMGYIHDNFSGIWDETLEISSFSASNPLNNQEALNRSYDSVNLGLVNVIKGSQCQGKKT
ncbi:hypothetical protein PORY_001812 [Pneumocystis oryctolagi]|uniref:Uncharacterized protein n=1 Tax=Pneumocystis oryctolagi TaxID=42067 RepID=A0ACB7CHJ7_9ASCO|nr:hypothetical protein PORY_001812 [Pneumocystis oryctolagi]